MTTSTTTTTTTMTMTMTMATTIPLSYVEFYCGVGGWTMALEEATKRIAMESNGTIEFALDRLAALDHSTVCLDVLEHNFPRNVSRNTTTTTTRAVTDAAAAAAAAVVDETTTESKKKRKRQQGKGKTSIPKLKSIDIERLTWKQIKSWGYAHVWVMSPPCQPHTRQHDNNSDNNNQKIDEQDARSKSFWHLCHLLQNQQQTDQTAADGIPDDWLPRIILLENVIGFESSNSCQQWRHVLSQRNYAISHYHVTPTQVGLPNDRPRYYCIAILSSQSLSQEQERRLSQQEQPLATVPTTPTPTPVDSILSFPEMSTSSISWETASTIAAAPQKACHESSSSSQPTRRLPPPIIHTHVKEYGIVPTDSIQNLPPLSTFLDSNHNDNASSSSSSTTTTTSTDIHASLRIPDKILESNSAWCFDIVTPADTRSACFTSSYGKFVRGTGSVLYDTNKNSSSTQNNDDMDQQQQQQRIFALQLPQDRTFHSEWADGLDLKSHLRYFSGMELTRLFGFTSHFTFPTVGDGGITMKQQWKLMGNSLNVRVAAQLCELALLTALSSSSINHVMKGNQQQENI